MKTILPLALLFFVLTGCASKKDKIEIKEKAEKSEVNNPVALGETIQQAIHSSANLTPAQKQELEGIISNNKQKAQELSEESYRFRAVLIQELLANNASRKKIKLIKKNIEQIEKKKLENTFSTIEMISAVVSNTPDKQNFSEALKNFEGANQQR